MGAVLRTRWDDLLRRVGIADDGLFESLVARYDEPHRRYHSTAHLAAVVAAVEDLAPRVGLAAHDGAALAAWFHDAVYDPRAGNNEERSAELAVTSLQSRGADGVLVSRVAELVRATATHETDGAPGAAVLFDADLAILAAPADVYDRYAVAIREEYAFVEESAFRRGRAAVLRSLLARPLFLTAPMEAREAFARANVERELDALEAP